MLPLFVEINSDEKINLFALLMTNPLTEKSHPVSGFHILELEIKLIIENTFMVSNNAVIANVKPLFTSFNQHIQCVKAGGQQ